MVPYGSALRDCSIRFGKPESDTATKYDTPYQAVYENIPVGEVKRIPAKRGEPAAYIYTHTYDQQLLPYLYGALREQGFLFTLDRDMAGMIKDTMWGWSL